MSYWVYLNDDEGAPVEVERHAEGGTYAMGGTSQAELNVTYNYGVHIRAALHEDGLRWLHGKTAQETIEALANAVATLGTQRHTGPWWVRCFGGSGCPEPSHPVWEKYKDVDINAPENAAILDEMRRKRLVYDTGGYWASTPGNAGYALSILLAWARQHPDAAWSVS